MSFLYQLVTPEFHFCSASNKKEDLFKTYVHSVSCALSTLSTSTMTPFDKVACLINNAELVHNPQDKYQNMMPLITDRLSVWLS